MSEWKKYNGSPEQIADMEEAQYGVLLSNNPSEIVDVRDMVCLSSYLNKHDVTSYLICNPNPLADMICQQARTGQPVWIMYEWRDSTGPNVATYATDTPDWNIPNAEYSFTPFEGEV